jgi:DNA-binding MarR family transcriptional regulator
MTAPWKMTERPGTDARRRGSGVPAEPTVQQLRRFDTAIQSIASLAARPRFHHAALERAGLGGPRPADHPARLIDPTLYGVMLALGGQGPPRPQNLALRLGLDPSTVCHHLRTLETRGLIDRRALLSRRRQSAARITAAGAQAMAALTAARHELLAYLLRDWCAAALADVVNLTAEFADDVRVFNLDVERERSNRRRSARDRRAAEAVRAGGAPNILADDQGGASTVSQVRTAEPSDEEDTAFWSAPWGS